jgi:hypothetical protein
MRTTVDSTLPWWIAGPILGLVIGEQASNSSRPYDALVAVEDGAVLIDILNSPPVAGSIYVAIASGMVFLTLVLEPRANRWANIVLPILYIISIAVSVIGEDWAYFYFLSIAESALLLLIIWYAWTWPRQEAM